MLKSSHKSYSRHQRGSKEEKSKDAVIMSNVIQLGYVKRTESESKSDEEGDRAICSLLIKGRTVAWLSFAPDISNMILVAYEPKPSTGERKDMFDSQSLVALWDIRNPTNAVRFVDAAVLHASRSNTC
jgi:hypothetical protein